ncbi:MAG: hypothetical protein ABJB74_10605 [Gemmatimonas sp.]
MKWSRKRIAIALWCVASSFVTHSIAAQSGSKASANSLTCADCTHRSVLVTQLGAGDADTPDFSIFTRVSRLRGGRFVVGPVNGRKDIAVFTADGKFERMLGRTGAGPGEYRSPANCGVFLGDSVWVFDVTLRRLSIFGPDLRFVRSMPFVDHRSLAFAPSGVIIGRADFPSDKVRAGQALHQYDANTGTHIRSYGGKETIYNLTSDARGTVWAVVPEPMRVVSFGGDGVRGREVRVHPNWVPFPAIKPRTQPGKPASDEQPATPPIIVEPFASVNSISIAANGEFWILGGVPNADWRKGINPYLPPPPERKGVVPVNDPSSKIRALNGWYDGMVEVVATDQNGTTRAIARAKFNGAVSYFLTDGLFSSMTADSDGVVAINIWKLVPK